jgi:hypothetical protein
MAIMLREIPTKIQKLLFEKQGNFSTEKMRRVSMEQTIYMLLDSAYLKSEEAEGKKGKSK